jgi:two-component system sensor histidine kinase UhpB
LTLKTRILSGYLALAIAAGLFSVLTIEYFYTEVARSHEESARRLRVRNLTNEVSNHISERQSELERVLATGKGASLAAGDGQVLRDKLLLQELIDLDPGGRSYGGLIKEYTELVREWEEETARMEKELAQRSGRAPADRRYDVSGTARISEKERSIFRRVKAVEVQLLSSTEKGILSGSKMAITTTRYIRNFHVALGILCVLVSIGLGIVLSRRIVSGLNLFIHMASEISAGNLSHRVPVGSREDELDMLAISFNQMAEMFEENIRILHESEQKYSVSVENASDGVLIIRDERFVFCNRAFSRITGYDQNDLLGMDIYDMLAPEIVNRARERYRKMMVSEKEPKMGEIQIVCKDGTIRHLEINSGLIEYRREKAILAILRDMTERRDYQQKLRKLSEQVIQTQEEERKRIAHELHDEIGQTMTAIDLNMELLNKYTELPVISDNFTRICEDIRKLVLKGIDDIHRISYNLRPHLLDNFGLVSALRWFAEDFHERTGIKISLRVEGEPLELSSGFETLIYRITQEALTNVMRHAEAGQVSILFRSSPEVAELVIEDDGKGFSVKDVLRAGDEGKGLGIFGMKERVSAFGGIFTIVSGEPKGTRLVAKFPSPGSS